MIDLYKPNPSKNFIYEVDKEVFERAIFENFIESAQYFKSIPKYYLGDPLKKEPDIIAEISNNKYAFELGAIISNNHLRRDIYREELRQKLNDHLKKWIPDNIEIDLYFKQIPCSYCNIEANVKDYNTLSNFLYRIDIKEFNDPAQIRTVLKKSKSENKTGEITYSYHQHAEAIEFSGESTYTCSKYPNIKETSKEFISFKDELIRLITDNSVNWEIIKYEKSYGIFEDFNQYYEAFTHKKIVFSEYNGYEYIPNIPLDFTSKKVRAKFENPENKYEKSSFFKTVLLLHNKLQRFVISRNAYYNTPSCDLYYSYRFDFVNNYNMVLDLLRKEITNSNCKTFYDEIYFLDYTGTFFSSALPKFIKI